MMNVIEKSFEEEQLELFILKDFLLVFRCFERNFKEAFYKVFEKANEEKKNRVYFYIGCVSDISYINITYDTYEAVKEVRKYDKEKILKSMSLNNIVKLNSKELFFEKEKLDIRSFNQKMTTLDFESSCKKVIDMRNRIAHEYSLAEFNEKCIVESLNKNVIITKLEGFYENYEEKLDFTSLSENSIAIFSNIFYIKRLNKEVEKLL